LVCNPCITGVTCVTCSEASGKLIMYYSAVWCAKLVSSKLTKRNNTKRFKRVFFLQQFSFVFLSFM
jgi:hypothetical protein